MLSENKLHRDPIDLELVRETSLSDFSEWLISSVGGPGNIPEDILIKIKDLHLLARELASILELKREGDSLWLCQSRLREPLIGNEGIALVRNGRPIIYARVIDY